MDWKELDSKRTEFIKKTENSLLRRIKRAQNGISSLVSELLLDLETNSKGLFKNSVRNLGKVDKKLNQIFEALVKETRTNTVKWIIDSVKKILNFNYRYIRLFSPITKNYFKKLEKRIIKNLGWNSAKKEIFKGSLLAVVTDFSDIKKAVQSFINGGIQNTLSLKNFSKQVKGFISEGKNSLTSVFGGATKDVFITTSRVAQFDLAKKAKMKYFVYIGSKVDATRPFCCQRYNKVYTFDFAKAWDDLEWQGKKDNNNVFKDCGGINCRHALSPVSKEIAERIAKQRGGIDTYRELPKKTKKAA